MIGDVVFAPLAEDSLNSLYLSRLPVRIGELSLILSTTHMIIMFIEWSQPVYQNA